jgi:hypothetical protein
MTLSRSGGGASVHEVSRTATSVVDTRVAAKAVFLALALGSVVFFVARFWTVYAAGQLFHRLGFDWTLFYAQAEALRAGVGAGIYDQAVIDRFLQPMAVSQQSLDGWPQPYPPWFAAAMVPLALLPAPLAFAVWLCASLVAACFLAFRVKQFLPNLGVLGALLAILAAIPVAWGLFMGQPVVLLAVAVSEMYISLRAGHDFRAGVWLATLLLKPQYALLLGVFVLWKRRWAAVAGAIVGGVVLIALGVMAAGLDSMARFVAVIQSMSDLRNSVAGPQEMINWRSIVLAFRPGIGEHVGLIVVWGLSLLTMAAGLVVMRGAWAPRSPRFAAGFCTLTLGALVGSYHSHPHGAALLIVPLAAAWATPLFTGLTRAAILAAVYVPTIIVIWVTGFIERLSVSADSDVPLWTVWPNVLPALLFMLAFWLMWLDLEGRGMRFGGVQRWGRAWRAR